MATLSDIMAKLQGRDPDAEAKLASNADVAQKAEEARTGDKKPEEQGAVEDTYSPGGILEPDTYIAGGLLGLAGKAGMAGYRAATGAGRVAQLAEREAPAAATAATGLARSAESNAAGGTSSAAATAKPNSGAWGDALRNPDKLAQAVEDPAAANAAYLNNSREMRRDYQALQDAKGGTAFRQNTAAPASKPLDYQASNMRPPANVDARSEGNAAYKYWEKEAQPASTTASTAKGVSSLSYPGRDPKQAVKDLQSQLENLPKTPAGLKQGKELIKQIQSIRQDPQYNSRG